MRREDRSQIRLWGTDGCSLFSLLPLKQTSAPTLGRALNNTLLFHEPKAFFYQVQSPTKHSYSSFTLVWHWIPSTQQQVFFHFSWTRSIFLSSSTLYQTLLLQFHSGLAMDSLSSCSFFVFHFLSCSDGYVIQIFFYSCIVFENAWSQNLISKST